MTYACLHCIFSVLQTYQRSNNLDGYCPRTVNLLWLCVVSVASGRYQCYVVRLQVWGQIYYLHANFDFNGWRRIWEFGGRSDTLEQGVCRVRWVGKIVLFFGWVGGGGGGEACQGPIWNKDVWMLVMVTLGHTTPHPHPSPSFGLFLAPWIFTHVTNKMSPLIMCFTLLSRAPSGLFTCCGLTSWLMHFHWHYR